MRFGAGSGWSNLRAQDKWAEERPQDSSGWERALEPRQVRVVLRSKRTSRTRLARLHLSSSLAACAEPTPACSRLVLPHQAQSADEKCERLVSLSEFGPCPLRVRVAPSLSFSPPLAFSRLFPFLLQEALLFFLPFDFAHWTSALAGYVWRWTVRSRQRQGLISRLDPTHPPPPRSLTKSVCTPR